MNDINFIPEIPLTWLTCPIYAEGVLLPKRNESSPDRYSDGKVPFGRAWKEKLTVNDSALMIEREPDKFKAIGVFTGQKSDGLVIFDVDRNLGVIEKKWGKDLKKAPKVTSLRKNAAKFLFKVPQDLVTEVASISQTAAGHEGWEVLWGGQGVIAGEYYKEGIGKGAYKLKGDLFDVPDAPEWLLSRMKDQYKKNNQDVDTKYVDNRWSKRTKEERIAIVEGCLSVIGYKGPNSEDYWWEIGAMINNELPGVEGLKLWTDWSKKDPDYEHCWDNGDDPCERRWHGTWRNDGARYNMAHLIELADEVDPERKRFKNTGLDKVIDDVNSIPLKFSPNILTGPSLVQQADEAYETHKNPAFLEQELRRIAKESGCGLSDIERMSDSHNAFVRDGESEPVQLSNLKTQNIEYIIPGILAKPLTYLVHADGGTGKTALCQTIIKHILEEKPLNVYGEKVPVKKKKILWLNGDQNEAIIKNQFDCMGINANDPNLSVKNSFDLGWYSWFKDIQNKYKYDLVVIDSLDGCSISNKVEENRKEFSRPLRKFVNNNGIADKKVGFEACCIIVIHHNTKTGSFRGSSSIKAAVDETWNMVKIPSAELMERSLVPNSRLITVEKSREGREGTKMIFVLKPDFTYEIKHYMEDMMTDNPQEKKKVDVLNFIRKSEKPVCVADLANDPIGMGLSSGIRKRTLRYIFEFLEKNKLIQRVDTPVNVSSKGGRPPVYYVAPIVGKTIVPYTKRGKSMSKLNNIDIPMDSIDKENCQNPKIVKTSSVDSFDTNEVLPKQIVNETSSTGTNNSFATRSDVYKEDEDDKFWNTNNNLEKMTNSDVIEAFNDARSNNTDIIDI